MRHAVELLAIALFTLALTTPLASAQTLGEVTTATGIHGTLSRQGVSSSTSALGTVKRSLATSTKPRDYDFGSGSGTKSAKSRSRDNGGKQKIALRSSQTAAARGSGVAGGAAGRGTPSNAWANGATGWDGGSAGWATGGNGWDAGGGSGSVSRRPRS